MIDRLSKELEGIGLSEKESRVYLAALELGPSTAQTIAAKATVNRPTTYIAIESLVKKGLMSSITKGKKRFFVSEPPDKIFRMLDDEKKELEQKEDKVSKIMDDLKVLSLGSKDRPDVLFFEGIHGIERLREHFLNSKVKLIEEFFSVDEVYKRFPPSKDDHRHDPRLKNRINRVIYTSESGLVLPRFRDGNKKKERRSIPYDQYPFGGDIAICGDLVAIINSGPKPIGILIQHEIIASAFHQMFRLAWERAGQGMEIDEESTKK